MALGTASWARPGTEPTRWPAHGKQCLGPLPTRRRRRFFLRGAGRFGAGAWPLARRPGRRGVLGTEPAQWPIHGARRL